MKRFRNRKLICAAAVVLAIALGTTVLTEAAGPREFVSGLWKKRPTVKKVSESRLNPRNWMTRFSDRATGSSHVNDRVGGVTVSGNDGTANTSVRPDLYQDPFAVSETVSDTEDAGLSVAQKSSPTAAPSPRQRREASRQSTIPERRERENATRNVARRDGTGSSAPVLPDGLQGESDRSEPIDGGPVSAFLRPDSGNQFAPGFDSEFQRVVESVIRETDSPRPETKPSTRVMSGAGDVRGPVLAPQLPDHATGDNQETLLSGNDVGQLIDRSRRNMATTLAVPTERQESPQIHSHPGQPQRPVSLTDGTAPLLGGGHPAMLVPTSEGDSASSTSRRLQHQPDLRHEFSTGHSVPQRAEQLSPFGGPVRPRVVSNGAPTHSVPNNPRHERISYSAEEESPVFGTVHEGPAIARRDNEGLPRGLEGVSSAPEIDWSLDTQSNEPQTSFAIPWGFASFVVTVTASLFLAILLLRKRQVVTVVTSAPDAARESD